MGSTWTDFPSAFSPSSFAQLGSALPSLSPENAKSGHLPSKSSSGYNGQLASFIFLMAGLQDRLEEADMSMLFGKDISFSQRLRLGDGASFIVERSEWKGIRITGMTQNVQEKIGKYVALKFVQPITSPSRAGWRWNEVLNEIRVLLHTPIRYHPNIVRFLGLTWAAAEGTTSVFPVLAIEYAEYGSLSDFQRESGTLKFGIKKKICHDVSKGISILHACNIVHGDLKHENVLVYRNKNKDDPVPFTAKIGDFGGAMMDFSSDQFYSLRMFTPPWTAPEFRNMLKPDQLKLTDVYSLGLLIWRTVLDGQSPFQLEDFADLTSQSNGLHEMKISDQLLCIAQKSIRKNVKDIDSSEVEIFDFVFDNTIQAAPEKRNLVSVIAALQVANVSEVDSLIETGRETHRKRDETSRGAPPGQRGISSESLGIYLAKADYGDYDYQGNIPGSCSNLSSPDPAEHLFNPLQLKAILDWNLQEESFHDLEISVKLPSGFSPTQVPRSHAAFALYQCYVHEFGTTFEPERACHWLRVAAETDDDTRECYLAQAWCWRVHEALGVKLDVKIETLHDWMLTSIIRGHKRCITEAMAISSTLDRDSQKKWRDGIVIRKNFLRMHTNNTGMPQFISRKLRREYNLSDLNILDADIQTEFVFRGVASINDIYVNHRGDTLLHMAAAFGNLPALRHLVEKYNPAIDKYNQVAYETPLLTACRGGHLDCALYLLEKGAHPQGERYLGGESGPVVWSEDLPLNWLCSFTDAEIPIIAEKLCHFGGSLSHFRKNRLKLRGANWSDSEYYFTLPSSPLSRAVIMENIQAVKTLLKLGADPLEGFSPPASFCALYMAAILTLPHILEILLVHLDSKSPESGVATEMEILKLAIEQVLTVTDPTSLESRISRLGSKYKASLFDTLRLLNQRFQKIKQWETDGVENRRNAERTMLGKLVALGRFDIVDSLLRLGHSVEGSPESIPIVEAVKLNQEALFRLLIGHGANISTKVTNSDGTQLSLLQVLATRPSQSRPGLFIAKYLLKGGVPVDPLPDGSQSAFVSAVLRQDFDLADLLLKHGADPDFPTNFNGGFYLTVFGRLFFELTERNLESLKYLLSVEPYDYRSEVVSIPAIIPFNLRSLQEKASRPLPNLVVEKNTNFTIFQIATLLAATKTRSAGERHILRQMLDLVLSTEPYSSQEAIEAVGPAGGTALFIAAWAGELEIVSALLEKGANPNSLWKDYLPLQGALNGVKSHRDGSLQEDILERKSKKARFERYVLIAELLRKAGGVVDRQQIQPKVSM